MVFISPSDWKGGNMPSPETVLWSTKGTQVNATVDCSHHLYFEVQGKVQDSEFLFPYLCDFVTSR